MYQRKHPEYYHGVVKQSKRSVCLRIRVILIGEAELSENDEEYECNHTRLHPARYQSPRNRLKSSNSISLPCPVGKLHPNSEREHISNINQIACECQC